MDPTTPILEAKTTILGIDLAFLTAGILFMSACAAVYSAWLNKQAQKERRKAEELELRSKRPHISLRNFRVACNAIDEECWAYRILFDLKNVGINAATETCLYTANGMAPKGSSHYEWLMPRFKRTKADAFITKDDYFGAFVNIGHEDRPMPALDTDQYVYAVVRYRDAISKEAHEQKHLIKVSVAGRYTDETSSVEAVLLAEDQMIGVRKKLDNEFVEYLERDGKNEMYDDVHSETETT